LKNYYFTILVLTLLHLGCRENTKTGMPVVKSADSTELQIELRKFDAMSDAITLGNDTSIQDAIEKYRQYSEAFSASKFEEIKSKMYSLQYKAFQHFDQKESYKNPDLPLSFRKGCLKFLVHQHFMEGEYQKVLKLEADSKKMFGVTIDSNLISCIHKYQAITDSLSKTLLTPDSLYYFKAFATEKVCFSLYFERGTCAPRECPSRDKMLDSFVRKFPESQLCDNVEYHILCRYFQPGYCTDEEVLTNYNQSLKLLKKYPLNDIEANVCYDFLCNTSEMQKKPRRLIAQVYEQFFEKFPDYPDVENLHRIMENLKHEQPQH
jgi:hypothetical protein